jgi:hypothetical protein
VTNSLSKFVIDKPCKLKQVTSRKCETLDYTYTVFRPFGECYNIYLNDYYVDVVMLTAIAKN